MSDDWMQGIDAAEYTPPADGKQEPRVMTTREAIDEWIEEEQRPHDEAMTLGFETLDQGLGKPIRKGEVVLLAARTGVGKTWLVQHALERYLAQHYELAALLLSLEMPGFQIGERLAAHALDVSPSTARYRARVGETNADAILHAAPDLSRLLICDDLIPVSRIPAALVAAERLSGQRANVVAVDYLGLVKWEGKHVSLYERASEISRQLKQVAKEEHVIMLAAAQLSRGGGGDGTREPTLESLRDSGVIEEAADRVLVFWRDEWTDEDGEQSPRIADGVTIRGKIVKNRFGPIGFRTDMRFTESLRLVEVVETELPY
jgi:replicative DNA helicase